MLSAVNENSPIKQDLAADCTTRGILTILKKRGPTDANTLAELLSISAPGIRQHLYDLQEKCLVDFMEEARPMGRPAKIWKLTDKANACFPDNHAAVTQNLLRSIRATFGEEGMCKLLAQYAREQIQSYLERTRSCRTLAERLATLVNCRCEEGYMAELSEDEDGNTLFIENHCPISCAAQTCGELCDGELNMLREILGSEVRVERLEHMVNGHRRCVYRITDAAVVV